MKDYRGLSEAAPALGVHVNTLYKWVRSGLIPARQVGSKGKWEIDMEASQAFVKESKWDRKSQ